MAQVNYVVVIEWETLPDNYVFPKRIAFLDTLSLEQVTVLTVGNHLPQSEHEWHVPKDYLFTFLASAYFKMACLPTAEGGEPELGTNDPVAWNLFKDNQMNIHWLGTVPHRPNLPIWIQAMHLVNFVNEKKMIEWACEYLETNSEDKHNSIWKRIGNRLSRENTNKQQQ